MVIGACLWIERSQWVRLGGFPEWLESVGEDLYLCCAARLVGMRVRALNDSGYRHRQGHSFGGNKPVDGRLVSNYERRRLSERNKTFVLTIVTPTLLMWPLLGLHVLTLLIEGAILSILRRNPRIGMRIYWSACTAPIKYRKTLQEKRSSIQRQRQVSVLKYLKPYSLIPRKLSLLTRYGVPRVE